MLILCKHDIYSIFLHTQQIVFLSARLLNLISSETKLRSFCAFDLSLYKKISPCPYYRFMPTLHFMHSVDLVKKWQKRTALSLSLLRVLIDESTFLNSLNSCICFDQPKMVFNLFSRLRVTRVVCVASIEVLLFQPNPMNFGPSRSLMTSSNPQRPLYKCDQLSDWR